MIQKKLALVPLSLETNFPPPGHFCVEKFKREFETPASTFAWNRPRLTGGRSCDVLGSSDPCQAYARPHQPYPILSSVNSLCYRTIRTNQLLHRSRLRSKTHTTSGGPGGPEEQARPKRVHQGEVTTHPVKLTCVLSGCVLVHRSYRRRLLS
ncbi:hypothetical protein VTK26DRAFT_7905 [Humicola hyalothermophila]